MDAIDLLLNRASNGKLGEPGPDPETLRIALHAALRAPDHGLMRPTRIQLISGPAREQLGSVMQEALARRKPDASSDELTKERSKPLRAPMIIVVSARVEESPKGPPVEQLLTAGAAAHAILLALQARGYAGLWRTGPAAYDAQVKEALGLRPNDAVIAFLYAGTPRTPAPPLPRPTLEECVSEWAGNS